LKELDNAAEVIRKIIDDYIIQSESPDIILINRRISVLRRHLEEILSSDLYQRLKMIEKQITRAKNDPTIEKTQLFDLTTLALINNVPVNSKEWQEIAEQSLKILNALQTKRQKIKEEILYLEKRLTET